jgi:PIN domain nuclease of toxin-antitoxin system
MRYYIDTNILIFIASGDRKSLSREVMDILENYENRIYVSSRSVEELIDLFLKNKITNIVKKWENPEDIFSFILDETGFEIKYIQEEHLRTLAKLPLLADHGDPSDRIIISQAITEKIPLVSSDKKFFNYNKNGLEFVYNKR